MTTTVDNNNLLSQARTLSRDCPAVSATIILPLGTFRAPVRLERAELMVDATYAASATDFYVFQLKHGATVMATWSTQTAAQGAITAAVPVAMVLSADTGQNLVIAAAAVLTLTATKNASAADITPRIVLHGRSVAL